MTLRDNDPQRLEQLMEEVDSEWKEWSREERVNQVLQDFARVYSLVARIAWDVEAAKGNLNLQGYVRPEQTDYSLVAQAKDAIANQAVQGSSQLGVLIDRLEAEQQLIAGENFGDETEVGKLSDTVVILINCIRPISEVIRDAAVDARLITMDALETRRHRDLSEVDPVIRPEPEAS